MNNNDLAKLFSNSDPANLISKLDQKDKMLLDSLMKDAKAREEFLSSEAAQKIIKEILGG